MFPHTVTIYNVTQETDPNTFKDTIVNHITVLHGVLLDASKAVNVRESGLESADAVNLYIPFDVEAVDGVTGEPKTYIGPMDWTKSIVEERNGVWTMTLDGEGDGDTFLVKGEVVEPDSSFEKISLSHDGVYNITKVDEKDFGGDMAHWEVGGA